jgi:TRAP-type C4-dicarboxylate transport system permease small subunit
MTASQKAPMKRQTDNNNNTNSKEQKDQPVWKRYRGLVIPEAALAKVENWLNLIGVSLIMVSMAITMVQIVARYFFNRPFRGETDIIEILMAGILFLGLSYTLRVGGHVGVDILIDRFTGRTFHIVRLIAIAFSIFLFTFLTISAWNFTINSMKVGDVTPEIMFPIWPAKLVMTIGAFIITLRLIVQCIQNLLQVVSSNERAVL